MEFTPVKVLDTRYFDSPVRESQTKALPQADQYVALERSSEELCLIIGYNNIEKKMCEMKTTMICLKLCHKPDVFGRFELDEQNNWVNL